MCDKCKDGDHSWCARIMKTHGVCNCLNPLCSSMTAEHHTHREGL